MGCCCCKSRRKEDLYKPLLAGNEQEAVTKLLEFLDNRSDADRERQFFHGDALEALTTLSYSKNVELQRSAALTFAEVTEKGVQSIDERALDPLLLLIQSSDMEVQRAASAALGNLAVDDSNKRLIVRNGGLTHLTTLLTSPNAEVQCNACGCLTNLATIEENKVLIAKSSRALHLLVQLAESRDVRVQRNAAGALLNLTHTEENRRNLVEAGCLEVFVSLIESQDIDVQYYCAAALSNIAVDPVFRTKLLELKPGLVRSLIKLMQSNTPKVQTQTCLALRNLASDEHYQISIVQANALMYFLRLLRSNQPQVIAAAVAAVRNLSIHPSNQPRLIEAGFLETLLYLSDFREQPSNAESLLEEIQCHAISTIRNIATSPSSSEVLLKANGVKCMLQLLQNVRGAVQVEVSTTLAMFALNGELKEKMVEVDAFPPLLVGASSDIYEVQGNCAAALGNLATIAVSASHFEKHWEDVAAYLDRFLESGDVTLVRIATWTISQLTEYTSVRKLIRESTQLTQGLELVAKGKEREATSYAVSALQRLRQADDAEENQPNNVHAGVNGSAEGEQSLVNVS